MAHEVFLSFADRERPIAEAIRGRLEADQIRCWIAPRDIPGGRSWSAAIVEAIPRSRLLILVLSESAVASPHVRTEVLAAFDRKEDGRPRPLPILPFRVEKVHLSDEFRYMLAGSQIHDATEGLSEERFDLLARDVRWHLGRPPGPETSEAVPAAHPVARPTAPRVILAYKRDASADADLAPRIEAGLTARGIEVVADHRGKFDLDWGRKAHASLADADALIPLLSAASMGDEILEWQIRTAEELANDPGAGRTRGRPRIFPVCIRHQGEFPPDLASILGRHPYFLWNGEYDDARLVGDLEAAFRWPEPIKPPRPVPIGGLPLDSRSYVRRPTDDAFLSAIARRDSVVLIRGARQMGKTSLLARGLHQARESGASVAFVDLQKLNLSQLESAESLYRSLGRGLATTLGIDASPREDWDPDLGPNENFESFLTRRIFPEVPSAFVWAMDEVDRLFTCPFGSDVFALFRTWVNARSVDPSGPWGRLTLVLSYATEAHLFIQDINQSPFNVGTLVPLEDFSAEQIAELNVCYASPLRGAGEVRAFFDLVGGHPFLSNRGLFEIDHGGLTIDQFMATADRDEGVFGDHLRRILVLLSQDQELCDVVRGRLRGALDCKPRSFYRLRAAGVLAGNSAGEARFRCRLYESYLRGHLS